MHKSGRNAESGLSIVELLVVLVILAGLATLAIVQFRSSKVDLERQAIGREFKVYLERARFDSVKRRADGLNQATISLSNPRSFSARLDFDGNGILDLHDVRTVEFAQKSQTQILVSDRLNYPITITFDRRGHAVAVDRTGSAIRPVFTICSNCSSDSPDRTVLSISPAGTVAVTRNEPDPATLPDPVITNPPYLLNCYVYKSNSNGNSNTTPCPLQ